jgi:predicted nuclease with RNAse H fold
VLTLGLDLAAADERTAMAVVEWSAAGARVASLRLGVGDDEVVAAVPGVDKAGFDCPLGWPAKFVAFVNGELPETSNAAWRRGLAYRRTDEVVRTETGLIPLSVSADRIAHAAFRCAALLGRLAAGGVPVDRTGDGRVVEVYPAASLRRWGLTHRGYKNPGHPLVDELTSAAPWLDFGPFEQLARDSHDAFDAVVAALAARAAALGQVRRPDAAERAAAVTEGWIAVPVGALGDLIGT